MTKIKELRKKNRLSQSELANALGIHRIHAPKQKNRRVQFRLV